MKGSSSTVVLAMLASLAAALFTAGDACDKVPSMTWGETCLNGCRTPSQYNLCQETLQHAPDTAEVTVYAAVAANLAVRSYEATTAAAEQQLRNVSLPGDERAAYEQCVDRYAVARSRMARVVDDMSGCEFEHTVQEYVESVSAVEFCGDALSEFLGSPLVAMNAADHDVTIVAHDLGALIVGW